MGIDATLLRSRLDRLSACLDALEATDETITRRLAGEVCAEYLEDALEQSGKLLRKSLGPWLASNRQADRLTFRDVFRHTAKHGLLDVEATGPWFDYRDTVDGLVDREDDVQYDAVAIFLRLFRVSRGM